MKSILSCTLFGLLTVLSGCSGQHDGPIVELSRKWLENSQVVHEVFSELVAVHLLWLVNERIPEPMTFANFTYHHAGLQQEGASHIYNPIMHGYNVSTLHTLGDETPYKVFIRLNIPKAVISGTYDMNYTKYDIIKEYHYTGNGSYNHTFNQVNLWISLIVGTTGESGVGAGVRPKPIDVVSILSFDSCQLWAENFYEGDELWDDDRWERQSQLFKNHYDDLAGYTDLLISETVSSYFGMVFGMLELDQDGAYESLINIDWLLNPWFP